MLICIHWRFVRCLSRIGICFPECHTIHLSRLFSPRLIYPSAALHMHWVQLVVWVFRIVFVVRSFLLSKYFRDFWSTVKSILVTPQHAFGHWPIFDTCIMHAMHFCIRFLAYHNRVAELAAHSLHIVAERALATSAMCKCMRRLVVNWWNRSYCICTAIKTIVCKTYGLIESCFDCIFGFCMRFIIIC